MDKKLLALMSVFFLTFAIFTSIVFFNSKVGRSIGAQAQVQPSAETSLILAYPLEIAADGKASTSISVFVRDETSKPISNKTVYINASAGSVQPPAAVSGIDGKATASFTCTSPGISEIHAIIGNTVNIKQSVSIKCI